MSKKLEAFEKKYMKKDLPDIRPGDTVQVHQKIKERDPSSASGQVKERIQIFEGVVLARKHGKGIGSAITVRKIAQGIGVERIFSIHSLGIAKIEIIKRGKVRRAKLYYLRNAKGKNAKLKSRQFGVPLRAETPVAKEE